MYDKYKQPYKEILQDAAYKAHPDEISLVDSQL